MENLEPQINKSNNASLKILGVFIALILGAIGLFHFWPKQTQKPLVKSDSLLLTNSLSSAFYIARSRAVALKTPVAICAIDVNTKKCIISTNWSRGWQVYIPSTDEIIHTYKPTFPDAISSSPSMVNPTFGPNGNLEVGPFTFTVAPKGCIEKYTITISASGEIKIEKGSCH